MPGISDQEIDELFKRPGLSLEERRYNQRRDYEDWYSEKHNVVDSDAWVVDGLIQRQMEYLRSLAAHEDTTKPMPNIQWLYKCRDFIEYWNCKLCEGFDTIDPRWVLTLDSYIMRLATEFRLPHHH